MESTPPVAVEADRPLRSRALARMAATGIYLLRGVSHGLQRAARARAVSQGTTLRRVLLQGLQEYAAGTWTPQAEGPESPAVPRALSRPAARFVQICASQNDLFTLDEGGDVHQYNFTAKAWEKLVATRSPCAPGRGSRGARDVEHPGLS